MSIQLPQRTLFSYMGSKKKWMQKWSPLLPPHSLYVSVFGGSGADILFKQPSEMEVFNDKDGDINNLFRVLRTQQEQLIRLIEYTPAKSRATYNEALSMLLDPRTDRLNRAWAFLVVAHQGYRSRHPRLQQPSCYTGLKLANRCIAQWLNLPQTITEIVERFRDVQLEEKDFREVIARYDGPNTLFFVDPPYHPETRAGRYYVHELDHSRHEELLDVLTNVQGKVWLCGYDHSLYADVLRNWQREEYVSFSPHASKTARTEVVWTNFDPARAA